MHTGAAYWPALAMVSSWNNLQIKQSAPSVPSQLHSCISQEILIYSPHVDFISLHFLNGKKVNQATVTFTELTINATKCKKLQEANTTRNEVTIKISQ